MRPMTPHAHLTAARALISHPAHWTQGCAARDAAGNPSVDECMNDAVCYCSIGALWKALGSIASGQAEDIMQDVVISATRFPNIPSFNDHATTTHADVLRVFDLAVAAATRDEV